MSAPRVKLRHLAGIFSVCKLSPEAAIPEWAQGPEFVAITRSKDELSIVCRAELVPHDVQASRTWRCLQFVGPFDFNETGIVLSVIRPISESGIGVFVVSTFDTDYLLIQAADFERAEELLKQAGHTFV